MNKQVVYKGIILAKGSAAIELWQAWQKEKSSERNKIQKKLDDHLKAINEKYVQLPDHLVNFKIGTMYE